MSKTLDELSKQAFVYECASRALARGSLTHFLHAQAFRLVHPLGQGKEGRTFEGMLVACRESATTSVGQPGSPGGRGLKRASAAPCL